MGTATSYCTSPSKLLNFGCLCILHMNDLRGRADPARGLQSFDSIRHQIFRRSVAIAGTAQWTSRKRGCCRNGQCLCLAAASVDNCGAMSLQLKKNRGRNTWFGAASAFRLFWWIAPTGCIQDEPFKFNHSLVSHSCIGGCVQRCKRPNGHETANATTATNRHESTTIRDRRSVDQFDRGPLDRIATQVMALVGSAIQRLGVPPGVGPDILGTTVTRTRCSRTPCTIGLSNRCIRGSHAFSCRIDGLFSGSHTGYQLERLG